MYYLFSETYVLLICETYLDSTVGADDEDLVTEGYKFVRAGHPSNQER